jgi:hypothetical protein
MSNLSKETENAFDRAKAQPAQRDDRKNKFQRHQEVVDGQRRDTTAHENRVKKLADDNARWTKKSFQPTAAGGTPLPDDLAKLKTTSDADRAARRNPAVVAAPFIAPTVQTITAIVNGWKTQTTNGLSYFDSAFNHRNMTLRIRDQFDIGALPQWSVEALDEAFAFLLANNYLETPFRTGTVHPRGQSAPKRYPYVMPEQAAEESERNRDEDFARTTAEIERALSLPFEQLRREARQGFKSAAAGVENIGERVR